jgi:TetR/AcrR family transcriptional repressor of nem operon
LKAFIQQAQLLSTDREKTLQSVVLMIGGLALSRALDDEEFSDELLMACKAGVTSLSTQEGADVS